MKTTAKTWTLKLKRLVNRVESEESSEKDPLIPTAPKIKKTLKCPKVKFLILRTCIFHRLIRVFCGSEMEADR